MKSKYFVEPLVRPFCFRRVRRPDQQMYVPRPKRASYGNDQPRSRHNSSSRTSLDSSDEKTESIVERKEESRLCETNVTLLSESCELLSQNELPTARQVDSVNENDQLHDSSINFKSMTSKDCDDCSTVEPDKTSTSNLIPVIPAPEEISNRLGSQLDESSTKNGCLDGELLSEMEVDCCDCNSKVTNKSSSTEENCLSNNSKNDDKSISKGILVESSNEKNSPQIIHNGDKRQSDSREELTSSKVELMETISISSESTGCGSGGTTSSSDSKSNSSSSDSENVQSHYKHSRDDKDTETSSICSNDKERTNNGSCTNNSKQKNLKPLNTVSTLPLSDVLVISDSSSSNDSITMSTSEKKTEIKIEDVKKPKVPNRSKREKHMKKSRAVQPEECDWESLYDDSGECLVPSLMEEVSQIIGVDSSTVIL